MRYSFRPPNADYLGFPATVDGIVRTAQRAEALGYDALLVNDHVMVKGAPDMVAAWGNTFDPLITLTYLAARTERIALATSVLIAPYRNPIVTAKMVATLDQFSGGRVILGVGAGWTEVEFAALGVEHAGRGALTDEYLRIYQACWAPDPVSFSGDHHRFEAMHCSPKPLQQPHPPLWVGGSSNPALRRAAAFAQVWQPVPMALDALRERKAFLEQACAAIGRQQAPRIRMSFRVNFNAITGKDPVGADGSRVRGHGTPADIIADLVALRDGAGLDEFQINYNGCGSLEQLEASMELFMREVAPALE